MGRFSTTVQIKNNTDRASFISAFNDVMARRGFVPCSEDEAAVSYFFGFSEWWVTVTSDSYTDNPATTRDDTQRFANEMKTSAFIVEVVDSDFAILMLYGEKTDEVIVGDGSGYGIEDAPKGNRECWEHLLAEDKTWEKLSEIWGKDEVFVEDVMWKSAPVLGINPEFMCADFRDFSEKGENSENDRNITAFYFKKAGTNGKPLTLNAAFVKVFGEALEPLGFKKIKSEYPYFVRVVNGEIIHIITYRTEYPDRTDEKSFNILGGVAAVYQEDLDLTQNPIDGNIEWLENNYTMHRKTSDECNMNSFESIWKFSYKSIDEDSMLSELQYSLDITKKIMLPIIGNVKDLNSCIEYYYQVSHFRLNFTCNAEEFANNPNPRCSKCYWLVKANYKGDGLKKATEKSLANTDRLMKDGRCGYTQEEFENECEGARNFVIQQNIIRDKFQSDDKLKAKVMSLLEQCKAKNTATFRSYGIEI
ncbi:MAG: hypothetical protein K2N06_01075 [Oscillospiraceae bacterium]|nr:hypothetical protein [Oscillospiraceae bacterium]